MTLPQQLVVATGNRGKLAEFQALLPTHTLIPQSDYQIEPVEETGLTFVENALLKARHAAAVTGLPALADDSGLVVAALNGAPGIYSARYAGQAQDFQANIDKLLQALIDVPPEKRQAQFVCVIVYLRHPSDPLPFIAQGTWTGAIALSQQGREGFGYDPVFYVPELQCTAAELSADKKNQLSHRAKALQALQACRIK